MGLRGGEGGLGRRAARRERTDLFAEILEVVKRFHGQARVTRVSYAVGMPVDRLKEALARLLEMNLLARSSFGEVVVYDLTPRGQEFLNVYWKMRAFTVLLARDPEGIRGAASPPASAPASAARSR